MPKKTSKKVESPAAPTTESDKFLDAVRDALDHLTDVTWLGEHSPLAAPYFIGERLLPNATGTAQERGAALRTALEEAMRSLDDEQKALIRQRYYRKGDSLDKRLNALAKSKSTYLRQLKPAVEAIARELNRLVVPPLRAEHAQRDGMLGRAAALAQATTALQRKQTVALTGPGGIGKTTLGAAIARQWGVATAFWFTVRPGLNDRLNNFVFALAYFLRGLGASNTWRQLAADKGKLELRPLLGLLRHDLQALSDDDKNKLPLLCVDEIDLLRDGNADHAQLLALIEALHGSAALLVIGQQLQFEPHQHQLLKGITLEEASQLLHRLNVTALDAAALQDLWQATRGNPALIKFSAALLLMGEALPMVLQELGQAPLVAVLLRRIWRRLSEAERLLLMRIAVYRTPAPLDVWPDASDRDAIEQLTTRQLLAVSTGEVSVISHAREFVLERIPADAQAPLHLAAAHTYEQRGEYTAAAQHYVAGKQPALAVWSWFAHRDAELERGQGPTALALFRQVAQSDLPQEADRRVLAVLRAELLQRAGEAGEVLDELKNVGGVFDGLTARIYSLRGDALLALDQFKQALDQYRHGMDGLMGSPLLQMSNIRLHTAYALWRDRNFSSAREEAVSARCEAENMLGLVEEDSGNFALARSHYESAFQHCQNITLGLKLRTRILQSMGRLAWRQGDGAAAVSLLEQATKTTQSIGDLRLGLAVQIDLSGAYIVAKQPEKALRIAKEGAKTADTLGQSYFSAGLNSNASEACFSLGLFDEAEHFALQSLREEQTQHRPYALTILGRVHTARAQYKLAKSNLQFAVKSAQESEDTYAEAFAWRAMVELQRATGDLRIEKNARRKAENLFQSLGLHNEIEAMQQITGFV